MKADIHFYGHWNHRKVFIELVDQPTADNCLFSVFDRSICPQPGVETIK